MTPAKEPFYAATYLPKTGRHGRPGLLELLPWIAQKWRSEPDFLLEAAQEIVREMQMREGGGPAAGLTLQHHDTAEASLKKSFAPRTGGFGRAPRFPRPHDLQYLLQRHCLSGDGVCLEMVETTLLNMRCGGLYDQLGYGFHRYATDERWLVPHFEKMLYDQAGLIMAYLEAWCVTGQSTYAATVEEIIDYLRRDMLAPEGAFYSAEDADSEGEEGTFYTWDAGEVERLLGARAGDFCATYRVSAAGNYHEEVSGRPTGRNILHLPPVAETLASARQQLREERSILYDARTLRVRPHRDDKIITAWNGLLVSAMARSGRLLDRPEDVAQAGRTAGFLLETLCVNGRLLRRYRDGDAGIDGFSEDYAFLVRGLLDLYAADFNPRWLADAVQLASVLVTKFQDAATGRLYDTACDSEALLVRPASTFDGAMPAAGSVALESFGRLYLLTGKEAWRASAERLMQAVSAEVTRYPAGFTACLRASNWLLRPTREVVIVGDADDPACREMLAIVRGQDAPQTVALYKPARQGEELVRLAPYLAAMHADEGRATAYLCENFVCLRPLTDAGALQRQLMTVPGSTDDTA